MEYYQIILSSYGWQGVALVALILLFVVIQVCYYSFRFAPLNSYRIKKRQMLHSSLPPVSIVVPMFSEDYDYLDNTLPLLLSQEAEQFEVVIVYVGCDGDFFEDILHLKSMVHNIVATKIERNERFPISIKTALNVGIKAASYEHILFTTTDARPVSDKWVSLISRGFQRGDVVLGYCGVERDDNKLDSYFIRATRLFDSMFWLSSAIKGKPYRGIRSNMGFTRSLYFEAKGFNHLNMNVGEDDLFLQKIMTRENTCVILSPRATVMQRCWGRLDGLVDTTRYYGSARPFYPLAARNYVGWEFSSRVLLFALSVVGIIFLPLELKAAIVVLLLLRVLFMLLSVSRVASRVGEEKIVGRYIIFDLLNPLFALYMSIKMIRRDKRAWR